MTDLLNSQASTSLGDIASPVQTSGDQGGASSQTPITTATAETAVGRPDWLPETFWNPEKNAPKTELFSQFDELQKFKAEYDTRSAAVPKDATGYKLELPADFEGRDQIKLDDKNPLVAVARDFALKAGASQEQFSALVGQFVGQQLAAQKQMQAEYAAEKAKLGPDADKRSQAAYAALAARVGEDNIGFFTGEKRGAGLVEAIEKLLGPNGPAYSQNGNAQANAGEIPGYEKMTFQQRMAVHYNRLAGAR